jgi:hypothetical protein
MMGTWIVASPTWAQLVVCMHHLAAGHGVAPLPLFFSGIVDLLVQLCLV